MYSGIHKQIWVLIPLEISIEANSSMFKGKQSAGVSMCNYLLLVASRGNIFTLKQNDQLF